IPTVIVELARRTENRSNSSRERLLHSFYSVADLKTSKINTPIFEGRRVSSSKVIRRSFTRAAGRNKPHVEGSLPALTRLNANRGSRVRNFLEGVWKILHSTCKSR